MKNKMKTIMIAVLTLIMFASCQKEEPVTPPNPSQPPAPPTVVIDEYKVVVQVYDNVYVSNTSGYLNLYTYWTDLQAFYYETIPATSVQNTGYGDITEYNFELEEGEDAYIRFYFESIWSLGIDANDFVDVTVYKNENQIYYRHGTNGRTDLGPTEIDLLP